MSSEIHKYIQFLKLYHNRSELKIDFKIPLYMWTEGNYIKGCKNGRKAYVQQYATTTTKLKYIYPSMFKI